MLFWPLFYCYYEVLLELCRSVPKVSKFIALFEDYVTFVMQCYHKNLNDCVSYFLTTTSFCICIRISFSWCTSDLPPTQQFPEFFSENTISGGVIINGFIVLLRYKGNWIVKLDCVTRTEFKCAPVWHSTDKQIQSERKPHATQPKLRSVRWKHVVVVARLDNSYVPVDPLLLELSTQRTLQQNPEAGTRGRRKSTFQWLPRRKLTALTLLRTTHRWLLRWWCTDWWLIAV